MIKQNYRRTTKIIYSLFAVFLLGTVIGQNFYPFVVYSEEVEEYQEEIEEKEAEKNKKEQILSETQKEIDEINESNMSISSKISALDRKMKDAEKRLKNSEKKLKEKEEALKVKEKELKGKEDKVKVSSTKLYKSSQIGIVETLLNNNDDIFKTIQYRAYVIKAQLDIVRKVYAEFTVINDEKEKIQTEKEIIAAEKAALDESMITLENEKARLQQEIRTKLAMKSAVKNDILRLDKELSNLTSELKDAILKKANQTEAPEQTGGGNTDSGSGVSPQQPISGDGEYDIYIDNILIAENMPGAIRLISQSGGSSGNNVFQVNGSLHYRGVLEFRSDSNVYMINELPFEKYLYGLGEVPSSWPSESLKAQAVAGRGYAAKNWNKRSSKHYNLRDDTYDQNYTGYNKEKASYGSSWVAAVDATNGKILKSGSSIISAFYHSTCGGHTLASEEVWVSALSYTRAESDWYETTKSLDEIGCHSSWAREGSDTIKSYDCASPWSFKRWGDSDINYDLLVDLLNASIYLSIDPGSSTRQKNIRRSDLGGYSPEQIVSALGEGNLITDKVGTVTEVKSVYNTDQESISGSAKKTDKLSVYGTGGSAGKNYELSASVFRTVFNGRSPGSDHLLYSNFWTVKKERENVWNFYTRGYPHRVGMCQYGAYGRAKAGQDYEQILTHYYRGTHLGNFSSPSPFRVGITRVATGTSVVKSTQGGSFDVYSYGTKIRSVTEGSTVKIVKK